MVYPVVQEMPPNSIPPTSCPLNRVVKCAGIWLAFADHLVVLNNKAGVMLSGSPEPLFQPQTVAARFQMAASGASDALGFLQQVSEGYRIVASLPVHANQPE